MTITEIETAKHFFFFVLCTRTYNAELNAKKKIQNISCKTIYYRLNGLRCPGKIINETTSFLSEGVYTGSVSRLAREYDTPPHHVGPRALHGFTNRNEILLPVRILNACRLYSRTGLNTETPSTKKKFVKMLINSYFRKTKIEKKKLFFF